MIKNAHGLDPILLEAILESQRSKVDGHYKCVYCRQTMYRHRVLGHERKFATIEHLYPPGHAIDWVCFCCNNCNSSHRKPLREWFKGKYCIQRDINEDTVSDHIKRFLVSGLKEYYFLWLDQKGHDIITGDHWQTLREQDGVQYVGKLELPSNYQKSFDGIIEQIEKREFQRWYKDRDPNYARYVDHGEDYEYWHEGDSLYRRKYRA